MHKPEIIHIRNNKADAAIVFVHGFTGDALATWDSFIPHLVSRPECSSWDIVTINYPTTLSPDIKGLWSSDPNIERLAMYLSNILEEQPYKAFCIVAHSMGGLVAQQAIIHSQHLKRTLTHMFIFGTPSAGLRKAKAFAWYKSQVKDMAYGSNFITQLRKQWDTYFEEHKLNLTFLAVAGVEDQFVPIESSLDPFSVENQKIISGNHLTMLKVASPKARAIEIVAIGISGTSSYCKLIEHSSALAIETTEQRALILALADRPEELDIYSKCELALALDRLGHREQAMDIIKDEVNEPEALGILAGRYKRLWLTTRLKTYADRSFELYQQGFELTVDHDPEQAVYHQLNLSFFQIILYKKLYIAQKIALDVLTHLEKIPYSRWEIASKAEANLILGNFENSIIHYRQAIASKNYLPSELISIFDQAFYLVNSLEKLNINFKQATTSLNNLLNEKINTEELGTVATMGKIE